jgi:hypothetical protein
MRKKFPQRASAGTNKLWKPYEVITYPNLPARKLGLPGFAAKGSSARAEIPEVTRRGASQYISFRR